ncbi:hypothetical protein [Pseudomonas sp. TMP25]|uniref:hypothetical protein n=1 Tax=Pseudomonas sp. TMP25 TaxID=3136561 RepID=UPI003100CCF4
MSRVIQTAELSRYAKGKLESAKGTWFGRPVTAYLTDAYFVAGCCVGVIHRHVKADAYGRFQDGHRVRTSDVREAQRHDGFWTLRTFTGSLYVVATFKKSAGRQSLDVLLEHLKRGIHTTPHRLQ